MTSCKQTRPLSAWTHLICCECQKAVWHAMRIHQGQDINQAFGVPLRRANEICTTAIITNNVSSFQICHAASNSTTSQWLGSKHSAHHVVVSHGVLHEVLECLLVCVHRMRTLVIQEGLVKNPCPL